MISANRFATLVVILAAFLLAPVTQLFADDLSADLAARQIRCPQSQAVSMTYYPHTSLAGYQAISDNVNFWNIDDANKDYRNMQFTGAAVKADGEDFKFFCYYTGAGVGAASHRELASYTGGYQTCTFAGGTQTCKGTIDQCVLTCP